MGLITVSLPADGSTADVADYNVPITTITTLVNGQLDNANISTLAAIDGSKLANTSVTGTQIADSAITPAKILTGTGTTWVWQSWTPTWTNLTVGSGVNASKYIQVGKTVFFRLSFILGSGSSVGSNPTFTLPVTSVTYPGTATIPVLGSARLFDASVANYNGVVVWNTTTTASLQAFGTSGALISQSNLTATSPFTWTSPDEIYAQGFYEAA